MCGPPLKTPGSGIYLRKRLRGLTMPAVDALERLLRANSEAVVLGAAKDVLDRGGLKAAGRVEVAAAITVKRPW